MKGGGEGRRGKGRTKREGRGGGELDSAREGHREKAPPMTHGEHHLVGEQTWRRPG